MNAVQSPSIQTIPGTDLQYADLHTLCREYPNLATRLINLTIDGVHSNYWTIYSERPYSKKEKDKEIYTSYEYAPDWTKIFAMMVKAKH